MWQPLCLRYSLSKPLREAGGAKIICCLRNSKVLASREQMYSTLIMYGGTGLHPKIHVSETGWHKQHSDEQLYLLLGHVSHQNNDIHGMSKQPLLPSTLPG